MTPASLLILFFLFVAGAVSLAGYVFVIRPAKFAAPQIPADISLDGHRICRPRKPRLRASSA